MQLYSKYWEEFGLIPSVPFNRSGLSYIYAIKSLKTKYKLPDTMTDQKKMYSNN